MYIIKSDMRKAVTMDEKRRIMKNKKLHKIIGILGIIFSVLLGVVGTLLAFSAKWMFKTWTNLSMDDWCSILLHR